MVAQWQRDTAYNQGSIVAYQSQLWLAKWWNYNAIPGANAEGVWQQVRYC
jgi:chitodextrinase